jgi:hypothetical protein
MTWFQGLEIAFGLAVLILLDRIGRAIDGALTHLYQIKVATAATDHTMSLLLVAARHEKEPAETH